MHHTGTAHAHGKHNGKHNGQHNGKHTGGTQAAQPVHAADVCGMVVVAVVERT